MIRYDVGHMYLCLTRLYLGVITLIRHMVYGYGVSHSGRDKAIL